MLIRLTVYILPMPSNLYIGPLKTVFKTFLDCKHQSSVNISIGPPWTIIECLTGNICTRAWQTACRFPTGTWQTTSGTHTKALRLVNLEHVICYKSSNEFFLSVSLILASITVDQNQLFGGGRERGIKRTEYDTVKAREIAFSIPCHIEEFPFQISDCSCNIPASPL